MPPVDTYRPMLATAGTLADAGRDWAFEFKWDGVRALIHNDATGMRIITRNGNDVRATFPDLGPLHRALGTRDVVVDGEIVVLDPATGVPDFGLMQQRLHITDPHAAAERASLHPAAFFAFDILRLDREEVVGRTYVDRRRVLDRLAVADPHWERPSYHLGAGQALVDVSLGRGLEGVVAKRPDASYRAGERTRDWIKIRNVLREEFVVGGWQEGQSARAGTIGALLLGYHDPEGHLVYAGKVGTGFDDETLALLHRHMLLIGSGTRPFAADPAIPAAHWVRPDLVAEVEFRSWTRHGHVRHPSFKGLRADKTPDQVVRTPPPDNPHVMQHA